MTQPKRTAGEILNELHAMIKAGTQRSKKYDALSAELYALPRHTRPLWMCVSAATLEGVTTATDDEEEEEEDEEEEEEEEETSTVASECSESNEIDNESE